ncbi:hypothetical protein [uncultured Methanobacterium sp.]|uniref:hypothetical protein n=1 Tax=uncultured Methanobacterium sp. TaxID=176306 RepID=UPI002AA80D25|nr:hypothetical protein [uncultured Methanobacterium sp.]
MNEFLHKLIFTSIKSWMGSFILLNRLLIPLNNVISIYQSSTLGDLIILKSSNHNISPKNKERIMALISSLKSYKDNVKFVDYKSAEKDCEILASKILDKYPREKLESFCFKGIPRGGLIVLGMLSYALDLKPSQFVDSNDPTQPVMIVDDIALTGKRISQILNESKSSHLVIANLYSSPELRRSILNNEPNVKCCFSSHDLKDRSLENHPQNYSTWKKKMNKILGNRYWIGELDMVCFPWSEPNYSFWNPVTKKVEDGWKYLPPHKCLKNKSIMRIPPHKSIKCDFHLSPSVIIGIFDDEILLFQKNTANIYSLNGTSAMFFRALVTYGNFETSLEYLVHEHNFDSSKLHNDLKKYVNDLLKNEILKESSS